MGQLKKEYMTAKILDVLSKKHPILAKRPHRDIRTMTKMGDKEQITKDKLLYKKNLKKPELEVAYHVMRVYGRRNVLALRKEHATLFYKYFVDPTRK